MLIYQSIEVLISLLYHCNTLTTNHHSCDESHMIIKSSSQAVFHKKVIMVKL